MTCLVLDIETVPDLARWSPPAETPDVFPPTWAHRIVCVGTLALNQSYNALSSQSFAGDERTLLLDLSRFLSSLKPTIVTFNGRNFDLPVIALRCLCHAVPLPWYYQTRGARYRYSEEGHLDLCDALTDYGAGKMMTLDAAAKLIGLAGKGYVHGSDVSAMFDAGRIDEIERYCMDDVVQTALILLRLRLVQGELKQAEYAAARDTVARFGASAIPPTPIGATACVPTTRTVPAVSPESGATTSVLP